MTKMLILLLVTMVSIPSLARWPQEGAIDIKDMRLNPAKYIETKEEQCESDSGAIKNLTQDMSDYQSLLMEGGNKNNKDAQKKLVKIKAEVMEPKSCQDSFYKIYLAKSLELLLDDNLINFKNDYGLGLQDYEHQEKRAGYRLQPNQVEMASSNDVLYFLSLLLINRIPIHFLTDQDRNQLVQSSGNSLWTQKSIKTLGRYEVLGAFKCADHSIFLDATLPPYDLAATWMHEMDHLFRDLYGPVDIWLEHPLEAIRTDELLASAMGTFSQWNVRRAISVRRAPFGQLLAQQFLLRDGGQNRMDQFFFNGDLSFINRQGPLALFYSPKGPYSNLMRYNIYFTLRAYFTTAQWLVQNESFATVRKDWRTGGLYSADDTDNKIYQTADLLARADNIVTKAYFGGEILEKYDPKAHDESSVPLSDWAESVRFKRYLNNLAEDSGRGWGLNINGLFFQRYFNVVTNQNYVISQDKPILSDLIRELERRLTFKSPSCSAFESAQKEGKLDSYLNSEDDSTEPGKDGSRPGKDGSRPGKDGSRPSRDIRPCLDLHDQL